MRYMLLIVGDEAQYADRSEEERQAAMQGWTDYTQELIEAGAFVAGDGLQSSTTATTLRVQNGERLLTDGPFADTKEQVGGFYTIECKDLDEAIDWAAKMPSAEYGLTEIRPVMEYTGTSYEEAPASVQEGAAS
jgi:hypothetical protein